MWRGGVAWSRLLAGWAGRERTPPTRRPVRLDALESNGTTPKQTLGSAYLLSWGFQVVDQTAAGISPLWRPEDSLLCSRFPSKGFCAGKEQAKLLLSVVHKYQEKTKYKRKHVGLCHKNLFGCISCANQVQSDDCSFSNQLWRTTNMFANQVWCMLKCFWWWVELANGESQQKIRTLRECAKMTGTRRVCERDLLCSGWGQQSTCFHQGAISANQDYYPDY